MSYHSGHVCGGCPLYLEEKSDTEHQSSNNKLIYYHQRVIISVKFKSITFELRESAVSTIGGGRQRASHTDLMLGQN